jgi:hypothetical protein
MHPMGLDVLRQWPSHGSQDCPPSSDVRLGGGERGTDPTHGAAHPMSSALPWMMAASRAEIRSPLDLGTHGGVCGLAMEGQRPVDPGTNVTNMPALRGIGSTQHMDPVTQVDGPVMTEVLLHSVSAASGQG